MGGLCLISIYRELFAMIHSYHILGTGYEPAHWREHARQSCRASSAARARTHVKRRELGLAALAGAATACLGGGAAVVRPRELRAARSVLALMSFPRSTSMSAGDP